MVSPTYAGGGHTFTLEIRNAKKVQPTADTAGT